MTLRRRVALGLVGAALLAAGFLIGNSLGDGSEASEFGSAPATLPIDRSDVEVPSYVTHKGLPTLAVTSAEIATTEAGESGSLTESPTVAPEVEGKKEEKTPIKTPPSTSPSPEPGITVGEEEKKKTE